MAFEESGSVGRDTVFKTDSVTGLMTQNAISQTQVPSMDGGGDPGAEAAVAVKVSFGLPFLITATCHGAETDGQTHNFALLNKNSPFKFRVVDAKVIILDESSGTLTGDTISLFQGDGASGESFTRITGAMTPGSSTDDDVFSLMADDNTFDQDAAVIDVDESLRVEMVLADSSNHNLAVKIDVWCVRVQANE